MPGRRLIGGHRAADSAAGGGATRLGTRAVARAEPTAAAAGRSDAAATGPRDRPRRVSGGGANGCRPAHWLLPSAGVAADRRRHVVGRAVERTRPASWPRRRRAEVLLGRARRGRADPERRRHAAAAARCGRLDCGRRRRPRDVRVTWPGAMSGAARAARATAPVGLVHHAADQAERSRARRRSCARSPVEILPGREAPPRSRSRTPSVGKP